jgi:hypothetical protein
MMVELADEALSDAIRDEFHRVWDEAEPLVSPRSAAA